jgi:hypothetical protein
MMKKFTLACVMFLCTVFTFADPMDYLQYCISWMGKSEAVVKEKGAVQSGDDIDLREFGLHLLRHYIWAEGNIGYFAQTSDGIVVNTKCEMIIDGVKDGMMLPSSFQTKKEFDILAEEVRQMVYALGGSLENIREIAGIRTISYSFIYQKYIVRIGVFVYLNSSEFGGFGRVVYVISRQ